MSTSLAEQLRRLKAPQTTLLVDSKKRASILFDQKEAALKDRETIFDIGYSGLKELIALNPSFAQFESTLFDKNAREMQRAVESREVNEHLNETIKKFLVHLSPYLLLQSSHKCLEWLIRRFNINEYNRDEMMMLIFPYHETKIFVKCIQTMRLNDPNDKWNWLHKIQSPGVPLSKQAVLNRAASTSDTYFLDFVCKSIVYAANELQSRPNTLQVYYAFYCTTVVGALELADITEAQISIIYNAVSKGLKSNSVDFCSASMMIIGQLVSKTKLAKKLLESIVKKLLKIPHAKLQNDVVILLVLIYRNQPEIQEDIPRKCSDALMHNKWIASDLAQIYGEGINILPFFVPLLRHCLRRVQTNLEHRKYAKELSSKLLSECFFKGDDAASVVRCALESYVLPENEVITIDSDQEGGEKDGDDVVMKEASNASSKSIKSWYTHLLKSLERRYSSTFDTIVKELIRAPTATVSEKRKDSLKGVLSFLFTIVCTDDKVNLFEKLYHHNAQYRMDAIKYLVKNLEKMSFSDDSKGLLQNSIAERINDDSSIVVAEALKFDSATLVKIVGRTQLRQKLMDVLERTLATSHVWEPTGIAAIKHLTSKELCQVMSLEASTSIFMTALPFLLQSSRFDLSFTHQILNSCLAEKIPFIAMCKTAVGATNDKQKVCDIITKQFAAKNGLPPPSAILAYVKTLSEEELTISKAFYAMLVLSHTIGSKCSCETSFEILKLIKRFESSLKAAQINDRDKWMAHAAMGVYPLNLNIACIESIVEGTQFKPDPTRAGNELMITLSHEIFEHLVAGMQKNRSKPAKYELYANSVEKLLTRVCTDVGARIQFLTEYFVVEFSPKHCDTSLQVFAIEYLNELLDKQQTDSKIDAKGFIRILNGLRSPTEEVRRVTHKTLVACTEIESKYLPLIARLIEREEEIGMDPNQLALILHTILQNPSKNDLKTILNEFIELLPKELDPFHAALLMETLTYVNTVELLRACAQRTHAYLKFPSLSNPKAEKHSEHHVLNTNGSIIVRNFLMRFTPKTIVCVNDEPIIWQTLLKSVKAHKINITRNGKLVSVASVAVSVLNEDMFSALNEKHQLQTILALVRSATFCENPDLNIAIGKFFKQIVIDAKACIFLLENMAKCTTAVEEGPADAGGPVQKRRLGHFSPEIPLTTSQLLKQDDWKCGVTWLEFLQNRSAQKTLKQHLLVPPLFDILQKCLALVDQSSVEYTKQLILSCILNVCTVISSDGTANRELLPDSVFKIESVVKCIRGTQNPQTHHHALELLAHSAKMLPDQVLHHMTDLFTFIGSAVVRHDDAYSFQIISKIIASIIPTLIKHNEQKTDAQRTALVVPVLKVFSDIVLDVPEHRRLPLYVQLIETLDANDYLWMFLAVLIESQVLHEAKERQLGQTAGKQTSAGGEVPRRIEIALSLIKEFNCETIVITATKMLRFVQKLPMRSGGGGEEPEKVSPEISTIIDLNACRNREFRYYKYMCIQFVGNLTSSTEFVNKIAQLSEDETKQMKPHYQNAIISVLTLIPDVSKAAEQNVDSPHSLYWKTLLHHCYDVLDSVISLLSPNMVLVVVEGLLSHKLPSVRRKVIELLNNKLQFKTEFFTESDEENLIRLLDPLTNIVESIIDESKLVQSASAADNIGIQQISLVAIKLLSKQLAQKQSTKFKDILETLIEILRKAERVPRILLATVVLCLAELCSNLRAHSIAYLPRFMGMFLSILQKHAITPSISGSDNTLVAVIAAVLKIVSTLQLFLSPYLVDLIVSLCQIWDRIAEQPEKDVKVAAIESRLNGIWEKLSTTLQLRVLLPTIDQSYKQLIADGKQRCGIGPLMQLLKQTLEQQNASTISNFMGEITSFFITALQFRADNETDVDRLEDRIIEAFIAVTLKLSEGSFRPLYYRIFDWAFRSEQKNDDRAITFYKLSNEVAKALKSLYVLFASDVTINATEYLTTLNADTDVEKRSLLVHQIVSTLYQIFLHDSQGFVNGSRFESLLQPLVDQIESELVLRSEENKELLSKCLGQMGMAINDDIQWKQLNYQILMKTRNNDPDIRLFGMKVCVELASKLGEDYMPLLPETVPFLSELLEDENPKVEKECQRSVQELERILGEPLQKYF